MASGVTYKPFGPLAGLTFGNGVVLAQGYDQDYQLTGISAANGATTIQNLSNGFDPSGNITSIADSLSSGRSQSVSYDNLNRVLTASGIYGSQTYAYDGVGNRQSLAAGSTSSYTYASAANQVASITNMAPPATATGAYLYNAFRQRVQKVAGGVTTQFVYDQSGHLLEEADGSGTVQREYIWLDDTPVAMVDSSGSSPVLYFIHTDQLGTPQKLTDGSMTVVWDGIFDPFGNPASGASLAKTNLRFPGQYFDAEAALNQNWNRDYDPATGRYVQGDRIGLAGGINTYLYAMGNPLNFGDPTGNVAGVDDAAVGLGVVLSLGCAASPGCRNAVKQTMSYIGKVCGDILYSKAKNPPDIGPPNGWIQGPRRGRQYGPDGRLLYDIDKPHQGNQQPHVHEWPNGAREEPGRPVSPVPDRTEEN